MKKKTVLGIILTPLLIGVLTFAFNVALAPVQTEKNFAIPIQEASDDNWPMFRHDNMRTGYAESDTPDTNQTLWKSQMNYWLGYSSAIVADDKVFVNCKRLLALDAATGGLLWTFGEEEDDFWDAAFADGKVYVGSLAGLLYCLNASTGKLVWNRTVDSPIVSSPAIVDGKVLFGTLNGHFFVLAEGNGELLWEKKLGYQSALSPAVAYGKIFAVAFDLEDGPVGTISALDQDTGETLWNYSFPYVRYGLGTYQSVPLVSPAVTNNRVYIGAVSGLYCVNADSGDLMWSHNITEIVVTTSTTLGYDKVFVGAANGTDLDKSNIYAFNSTTGELIWNYPTGPTWPVAAPAVADHKLFVGTGDAKFCALSEANGNKIWSYNMGQYSGSPAVAHSKVFVGSSDGYVYAFGTPKIEAVSATVDIHPDALNLKSRGKWITAYIELPEGYNVSDIAVPAITLNYTVSAESFPISIGDYDTDETPDLMVKFDRADVISYILTNVNATELFEQRFMDITLTVTGYLNDGTQFQGSDTIKILHTPRGTGRGRHLFAI